MPGMATRRQSQTDLTGMQTQWAIGGVQAKRPVGVDAEIIALQQTLAELHLDLVTTQEVEALPVAQEGGEPALAPR